MGEVVPVPERCPRRDGEDEAGFDEIGRQQESKCESDMQVLLARCGARQSAMVSNREGGLNVRRCRDEYPKRFTASRCSRVA
jgi:hypothetical protein